MATFMGKKANNTYCGADARDMYLEALFGWLFVSSIILVLQSQPIPPAIADPARGQMKNWKITRTLRNYLPTELIARNWHKIPEPGGTWLKETNLRSLLIKGRVIAHAMFLSILGNVSRKKKARIQTHGKARVRTKSAIAQGNRTSQGRTRSKTAITNCNFSLTQLPLGHHPRRLTTWIISATEKTNIEYDKASLRDTWGSYDWGALEGNLGPRCLAYGFKQSCT